MTVRLVATDAAQLDALMELALAEARAAAEHGDVPVGAVVARADTGEVVARRHNERELSTDPTAHAEVLALRDAAAATGSWRLDDYVLVVTLEPCPMCAGAASTARIGARRVRRGRPEGRARSAASTTSASDPRLQPRVRPCSPASGPRSRRQCSRTSSRTGATRGASDAGHVESLGAAIRRLGGMRERPNRMVSKTIVAQVTLGSNPSPSANGNGRLPTRGRPFCACEWWESRETRVVV